MDGSWWHLILIIGALSKPIEIDLTKYPGIKECRAAAAILSKEKTQSGLQYRCDYKYEGPETEGHFKKKEEQG